MSSVTFFDPYASQESVPPPVPPLPPQFWSREPEVEPFSAKFFDKRQEMGTARKAYLKTLIGGTMAITILMFSCFSIYWGAIWKTPAHQLDGWVIDFDRSTVGSTVSQALLQSSVSSRISWSERSPSDFPGGIDQIANRIREEDTWVAIVINQNATESLNRAIESADSSYNGTRAVTMIGIEARNENAYRSIISPAVQQVLTIVSQRFAIQNTQALASSSSLSNIAANAPQLLASPIGFQLMNISPFDIPVASAITFVGLIYLLILSFFIVMIGHSAREESGLERHLTNRSVILVRVLSTLGAYFFLSIMYALLSLAFQVDFSRKFGPGGFVIFWMLSYCGMLSVGFTLEAAVTLMTNKIAPFFMIFLVIANVAVCAFPLQIMPRIYRYGYAMPFYNVSRAVRCVLFSTKNEIALNFGVLLAYMFVSCFITLPLAVYWRRGQAKSALKKEEIPVGASNTTVINKRNIFHKKNKRLESKGEV